MNKEKGILSNDIVVVCAWCVSGESVVDVHEKEGNIISHSICEECVEKVLEDFEYN